MSERTHSAESTPHKNTSRKALLSIVAGSAVLMVCAGIWFQFFQANPAASQTGSTPNPAASETPSNQVLARVNNQSITYDVVARECVAQYGEEILDNLINRLIIQQECERRSVSVSRTEVEQEVVDTAKKFNLPLDTWYQMLQSNKGITREQYHDNIIWPMLALKKLAGKQVTVTEHDMQIGFERDYGPRVKGRMILVEGNMRQASQIWDKCQATPNEFDRIAREFSADSNTRPLGGVIPPIRKHGGNKQIEEEAFKMQPGEISGLIQLAESRYVILKCEGFTDPVVDDIQVVWNDLLSQLQEEKTQEAVAKVFEDIKQNARIDNYLTRTSTGTATLNPVRQARAVNPTQGIRPASAATR